MRTRLALLLFVWLLACCPVAPLRAQATYATHRLQTMARLLSLPGIDTLRCGEYRHYRYRSHPLNLRINAWNEVEHIGFSLFRPEVKQQNPSPAYDFLERHLLEYQLLKNTEAAVRFGLEAVHFDTGTPETALQLDGTEAFSLSYIDQKAYRATWKRGEDTVLSIRFDMDYQLLTGCNAIELEDLFVRRLRRYRPPSGNAGRQPDILSQADYYVVPGNSYLTDAIRNDLYYRKQHGTWTLVHDSAQPYRTLANLMLAPDAPGHYGLCITLDKYGYREEQIHVPLKQWLHFCLQEGCTPYFGMKDKTGTAYTGTVFMVNNTKGYAHVLHVSIPADLPGRGNGTLQGRLYIYIPLFNVSDDYFKFHDPKK